MENAARNKANYLKAKEAFSAGDTDACMEFYAVDHQISSRPSEPGRDTGIRLFLTQIRETWGDIEITVEHVVAEKRSGNGEKPCNCDALKNGFRSSADV